MFTTYLLDPQLPLDPSERVWIEAALKEDLIAKAEARRFRIRYKLRSILHRLAPGFAAHLLSH